MNSTTKAKPRLCGVCGAEVPVDWKYCSSVCEIEGLKTLLSEKTERLARGRAKKKKLNCYGQIVWDTCVQELYARDSYDAKRRAHDLRGVGYVCTAKHVGKMPIRYCGSVRLVEITLLTAWRRQGSDDFPSVDIIHGLSFVNARAGE